MWCYSMSTCSNFCSHVLKKSQLHVKMWNSHSIFNLMCHVTYKMCVVHVWKCKILMCTFLFTQCVKKRPWLVKVNMWHCLISTLQNVHSLARMCVNVGHIKWRGKFHVIPCVRFRFQREKKASGTWMDVHVKMWSARFIILFSHVKA